jgi:hypothetical protein
MEQHKRMNTPRSWLLWGAIGCAAAVGTIAFFGLGLVGGYGSGVILLVTLAALFIVGAVAATSAAVVWGVFKAGEATRVPPIKCSGTQRVHYSLRLC